MNNAARTVKAAGKRRASRRPTRWPVRAMLSVTGIYPDAEVPALGGHQLYVVHAEQHVCNGNASAMLVALCCRRG